MKRLHVAHPFGQGDSVGVADPVDVTVDEALRVLEAETLTVGE